MRDEGISATNANLRSVMRGLEAKETVKALKRALGAEARRLKNAAARKLAQSGWSHSAKMGKNLSYGATRDLQGLYVSARNQGKRSMHQNRRGQLKPVAYWIDIGAGSASAPRRKRKGASTGWTKSARYMAAAEKEQGGAVAERLAREHEKQVKKLIEKKFKR